MAGGTGPSAGEGMRHPLQGVGAPRQGGVTGFRLSGPGPVRLPPRGTPGSGTEAGQCLEQREHGPLPEPPFRSLLGSGPL